MYEPDFNTRCYEDCNFFIENVLGYKMSRVHKEMINAALMNRYLAIEVPVGHSKTTTITKGYAIWRLWREDSGFEICEVGSALEQSAKVLEEIQGVLEENAFLKHLVPQNRTETWNKKTLVTSKGTKLYVKPFNDTARGVHPNILIYDDILRAGDSELTAQAGKDIFYSVFMPRGQTKRSQHILVGTPTGEDDLFDDIEKKSKEGKQWTHIHYSAITKIKPYGNIANPDDWLETLWPERFSLEELKLIRENISAGRFAREYLCDPQADGTSMFDQAKLAAGFDETREFVYQKQKGYTVMGLDIAFSSQSTADFTVLTIGTLLEEPFVVKQFVDDRMTTREIDSGIYVDRVIRVHGIDSRMISDMYELYGCQKIILDKSTGGVLVAGDLRNYGCNIEEQSFDSASRQMLLLNLWKIIEQQRLILPYKKEGNSEQDIKTLIYELKSMQNRKTKTNVDTFKSVAKHDDCVMSLALMCKDFNRQKVNMSCTITTTIEEEKKFFKPICDSDCVKTVKLPGFD